MGLMEYEVTENLKLATMKSHPPYTMLRLRVRSRQNPVSLNKSSCWFYILNNLVEPNLKIYVHTSKFCILISHSDNTVPILDTSVYVAFI
jgi:hypothetical protein